MAAGVAPRPFEDDAADRARIGRVADPVQHHLGDRALALGRLARRLVIDGGGQAIERARPVGGARAAEQEGPRRRIGEVGDRDRRVDLQRVLRRDLAERGRRGLRRRGAQARDAVGAARRIELDARRHRLLGDAERGHDEQRQPSARARPRRAIGGAPARANSIRSSQGRWRSKQSPIIGLPVLYIRNTPSRQASEHLAPPGAFSNARERKRVRHDRQAAVPSG